MSYTFNPFIGNLDNIGEVPVVFYSPTELEVETDIPTDGAIFGSSVRYVQKLPNLTVSYTNISGAYTTLTGLTGNSYRGNISLPSVPASLFPGTYYYNIKNLHQLYSTTIGPAHGITMMYTNSISSVGFPDLKLCEGIYLRGYNTLTKINFDNLEYVTGIGGYGNIDIEAIKLTDINFPKLKICDDGLSIGGYSTIEPLTSLSSINLPNLEIVGAVVLGPNQQYTSFKTWPNLKSLEFPNLEICGSLFLKGCIAVSALNFPKLKKLTGSTTFQACTALTDVNFPETPFIVGGYMAANWSQTNSLTSFKFPKLTYFQPSGVFNPIVLQSDASLKEVELGTDTLKWFGAPFTCNQTLTQSSVDKILKAFARLDGTNGTTSYNSTISLAGSNSAPSYTGGVTTTSDGSNFVRTGTTVVASVIGHGHTNGDIVTFTGNSQSALNGTYIITVNSPDEFQYTTPTSSNITGGGTVTMRRTTVATDGFRYFQTIALRGGTITIIFPD
jgi:hypothetical protein